jgi:hypothetical protein
MEKSDLTIISERLLAKLPEYYDASNDSTNEAVMRSVAVGVMNADALIREVEQAAHVQTASDIETLRELGSLIDVPPRETEEVEAYRARLIAEFQVVTSEATTNELIRNAADILSVSPRQIDVDENVIDGVVTLGLPRAAVESLDMTISEFVSALSRQVAAGIELVSISLGTAIYYSEDDYLASDFDPSRGYGTLDSSGNPTGGGTYSSIL